MGDFLSWAKNSKLMIYVLIGYMLILPFGGTVALRNVVFLLLVSCFAFYVFYKKINFPVLLPWMLWLIVALISVFYAVSWKYSANEWRVECFYNFLIFYFAVNSIQGRRHFEIFATAILLLTLANSVGGIMLWELDSPSKDGSFGGLNSGVGAYSTYAVLSIPMIAWLWFNLPKVGAIKQKSLIVFAVILVIVNLLLGKNRQVWISVVVELVVAYFLMGGLLQLRKKAISMLLAVMGGAVMFFWILLARARTWNVSAIVDILRGDERWKIWTECLDKAKESIVSGSGVGIYSFDMKYPGIWTDPMIHHGHNFILNKYLQMGLPGAVAFVALLGSILVFFLRRRDTGYESVLGIVVVVGMISKNITDDFFGRDVGYFFWGLAGAIVGVCLIGAKKTEKI